MADQQHPITPSDELVQKWTEEHRAIVDGSMYVEDYIAAQTARYRQIADAELEACCADIHVVYGQQRADWLREMRRPKPPSLAENVSKALDRLPGPGADSGYLRNWADKEAYGLRCAVRRALERLQELEGNG